MILASILLFIIAPALLLYATVAPMMRKLPPPYDCEDD